MSNLDCPPLFLPQLSNTKPTEPHIPIFAPRLEQLRKAKRVIVIINDQSQDLGVWAYRLLDNEGGITQGSCVGFVQAAQNKLWPRSQSDPGAKLPEVSTVDNDTEVSQKPDKPTTAVVVLNPGALWYSYKRKTTLSLNSWTALPRSSAVHPAIPVRDENLLSGHHTAQDHVRTVFEDVISNPDVVDPNAELYLVGLYDGANNALEYLDAHWDFYHRRIHALAFTQPQLHPSKLTNQDFKDFVARKARSFVVDVADRNTCVAVPTPDALFIEETSTANQEAQFFGADPSPEDAVDDPVLCPTFSSGGEHHPETIFPDVYPQILDFFHGVATTESLGSTYTNPIFEPAPRPKDAPQTTSPSPPPTAEDEKATANEEPSVDAQEQPKDSKPGLQVITSDLPSPGDKRPFARFRDAPDELSSSEPSPIDDAADPIEARLQRLGLALPHFGFQGFEAAEQTPFETLAAGLGARTTVKEGADEGTDGWTGGLSAGVGQDGGIEEVEVAGVKVPRELVTMAGFGAGGLGRGDGDAGADEASAEKAEGLKTTKQVVASGD